MVSWLRSWGLLPALLTLTIWCSGICAEEYSRACSLIINDPDANDIFDASLVQECLASVPFNQAVATRFLAYWNDTLRFQSTLTYLKNPPTTYQSPGVDILGGIQTIQDGIDSGAFATQYEFEFALQKLNFAARDEHLFLNAGIMGVFTFASPREVVSVSIDGLQVPKLYFYDDVVASQSFTAFQPSPIKVINGQDSAEYMQEFAANNSIGLIEPHAQWNQMMYRGAQAIQGISTVFGGNAWFYPGDTITWELENGTSIFDKFQGWYWTQGPTGALETPGDFYNCFVLGLLPASYDPYGVGDDTTDGATDAGDNGDDVPITNDTAAATSPGWGSVYYPDNPDVAQPGLGLDQGGFLSGYFLNSTSTAVLSIPSFNEYDDALHTFQTTVEQFLARSKAAGLTKMVIDLQGNSGGQVLLAIDTFVRFFPQLNPVASSQMRAHPATNVMGETMTAYYATLTTDDPAYAILAADEWVATSRINAETGVNFSSWAEFYGPHSTAQGDFTTTQQYNLSSAVFTTESVEDSSTNGTFVIASSSSTSQPPYAAEDIILLTDGTCGSACALFLELMHHQATVRVVTVGGLPDLTPMQGASGTRGARFLDLDAIDANIGFVQDLLQASSDPGSATFLPNRTTANDVFLLSAGVNLRDQVRAGSTTPLQFLYEPADCRIFLTPRTVVNYTALWEYAARAAWVEPRLCVAGGAGTSGGGADLPGTDTAVRAASTFDLDAYVPTLAASNSVDASSLDDALLDDGSKAEQKPIPCRNGQCGSGLVCRTVQYCSRFAKAAYCVPLCRYNGSGADCVATVLGTKSTCRNPSSAGIGFCDPAPVATCDSNGNINYLARLNGRRG